MFNAENSPEDPGQLAQRFTYYGLNNRRILRQAWQLVTQMLPKFEYSLL